MNYSTLEGTTSALNVLKTDLNSLKNACTSEVLELEVDKWSDVQNYIQEMIDKVEDAKTNWPTSIGSNMESIETNCKAV